MPLKVDGPSLVLAKWERIISVEPQPAECEAPNTICLNALGTIEFTDVETLSGPELPSVFRAHMWFHTSPRKDIRLLLAISRAPGGLQAKGVGHASHSAQRACLDSQLATELKLTVPSGAETRDGRNCFPI